MTVLQRGWTFFYEREWAVFVGILVFAVAVLNEALEIVSTQVEMAGTDFNWLTLVAIAQALITRWNVWSAQGAAQLKNLPVGD